MLISKCLHQEAYIHSWAESRRLYFGRHRSLLCATGAVGWESGDVGSHLLRGDRGRGVSSAIYFTR